MVGGALFVFIFPRGDCSEREARVFSEFPQYGGRGIEPEESKEQDACFISFTTEDLPERVVGYYKRQLTAHGWKLDPEEESQLFGRRGSGFGDAGRFAYNVLLEPIESPPDSTSVVVYVFERTE